MAISCPQDLAKRTETLNWLFWLQGAAPFLGGGFGHFYHYAPVKIEYAINRFTMEAKRLLDVLDKQLAHHPVCRGRRVHYCRYGHLAVVRQRGAGECL
ncbi:S-transferase [Salmonella enterica subsp. enterica]|uniref:S-transferase n=1 Tax=Salmonella enterica I TaxID=59201 RepID=A0A3S4JAS4_SALET|nr:S-transferase [Salmonella enterica subsp. enterica]